MIYELRIYRFHKGADNKKKFRAGFAKARRFMSKYGVTFVARVGKIPTATTSSSGFAPFPTPRPATRPFEAYYGSPEWAKIVDQIRR